MAAWVDFRLRDLLTGNRFGSLVKGMSREAVVDALGEPTDEGGTSRKYPRPSVYKYGDLQVLFDKETGQVDAVLIEVVAERTVYECKRSARLALCSDTRIDHRLGAIEAWLERSSIPYSRFEDHSGAGLAFDTGARIYAEGGIVTRLERAL